MQVDEFLFLGLERSAQNNSVGLAVGEQKAMAVFVLDGPPAVTNHRIAMAQRSWLHKTSRYLLLSIIEGATNNNYIAAY